MKLWEVLKALEENPKKRFECSLSSGFKALMSTSDGYFDLKIFDCYGKLISQEKKGGAFNENIRVNNDWQEVKQPVPWQKAIEAWANGGKVKCILHGKSFTYDSSKWGNMYSGDGYLCDSEILHGTWYIEG